MIFLLKIKLNNEPQVNIWPNLTNIQKYESIKSDVKFHIVKTIVEISGDCVLFSCL
jgi:hypothetical protein